MTSPQKPRLARSCMHAFMLLHFCLTGCSDEDRCEADKRQVESCNRVFRVDICATADGRCSVHCAARLSCDEFDDLDRGKPPAWFARCDAKCRERVTCGDGQEVPAYWECDGYEDCVDGADEGECRYYECRNGQLVREDAPCDEYSDCQDGTDEMDCPNSCSYETDTGVCQ